MALKVGKELFDLVKTDCDAAGPLCRNSQDTVQDEDCDEHVQCLVTKSSSVPDYDVDSDDDHPLTINMLEMDNTEQRRHGQPMLEMAGRRERALSHPAYMDGNLAKSRSWSD